MDSDNVLQSLGQLLSGTTSPSIRTYAVATIAAATAGAANESTRAAVAASESILRRLLVLTADPTAGRLALTALVNIAEHPSAVRTLISLRAVSRATTALLDKSSEQAHFAPLYAALLANITRLPQGVAVLVGEPDESILDEKNTTEDDRKEVTARAADRTFARAQFLRLVESLHHLPNILFFANACSSAYVRKVLLGLAFNSTQTPLDIHYCSSDRQGDDTHADPTINRPTNPTHPQRPLKTILRLLCKEDDKDSRFAAASAIRNTVMDQSCHPALIGRTPIVGALLARLVSPTHSLTSEDLSAAPEQVRIAVASPSTLKPEVEVEVRGLIVETLLLLCKSRDGRDALRTRRAYPILRDTHLHETDESIRETLDQIVSRTELLSEEDAP